MYPNSTYHKYPTQLRTKFIIFQILLYNSNLFKINLQKSDSKADKEPIKPVKEVEIKPTEGGAANKTETGCILS